MEAKVSAMEGSVLPSTCNNCRNKCEEMISDEQRREIFKDFNSETMDFEMKRLFVSQNIEVRPTSNRYGRSKKKEVRIFFLPLKYEKVRVCRSFFLKTLNIGKRLVECTLRRKLSGDFIFNDRRGRHTPVNKTDAKRVDYVRKHIADFIQKPRNYSLKQAVVTRFSNKTDDKDLLSAAETQLGVNSDHATKKLTIRKMYELYKERCETDNQRAVSEWVFRTIFRKQYNLSYDNHQSDTRSVQICEDDSPLDTFENSSTGFCARSEAMSEEDEDDEYEKKMQVFKHVYVAKLNLNPVANIPC